MIGRLLFAALLLASCSDASERGDAPQTATRDTAAACRQFTREGLKLKAKSRSALDEEVGRPSDTHVTMEPNRHVPNVQDSIIRLDYDGLTVQLRKPGPGGELIEHIAVSKRKWLNFPYFRPGVAATAVTEVLGQPQRQERNRLIYNCGETEAEAPVVFETQEGTVQRIVFNYYVD